MRQPTTALAVSLTAASLVAALVLAPTPRARAAAAPAGRDAGETLFHSKGCEHCHGPALLGTDRGPSLTGVGRKLHPDAIQHQIISGGDGMPAFGDILTADEVAHLVAFLQTQRQRPPRAPKRPPPTAAPKPPSSGSDDQS